jgi:hypothetical protein
LQNAASVRTADADMPLNLSAVAQYGAHKIRFKWDTAYTRVTDKNSGRSASSALIPREDSYGFRIGILLAAGGSGIVNRNA